jgi:hypothetical protein
MSRGIVVLDSLLSSSAEHFATSYDLDGIEPFTMVMVEWKENYSLHELRWDGSQKYFRKLDETAFHLWSSATLYPPQMMVAKEKLFAEHLSRVKEIAVGSMIDLHGQFLYEDWLKPPERVEVVATLSITAVAGNQTSLSMNYRDLVRKELPLTTLELHSDTNW